MKISQGKYQSQTKIRQKLQPKSLNYLKMKKEAEKIDNDNQKMLQRILTQYTITIYI